MKLWHTLSLPDIERELKTNFHDGLSEPEADSRFKEYGPNKLPEGKAEKLLLIFLRQFQSPLIYTLFAAAAVVFFLREFIDGFIILSVLLFNAAVGTIQEGKAQNTLLALKKFAETTAAVLRGGKEIIISDTMLIPGDIVILREGEKTPADCRLIASNNLMIDEAALTGESEPVYKSSEVLENPDLNITDQKNMVFKGTNIVVGNGSAVVVATGLNTAIGKISAKIEAIDTEIPLKTDIRHLSRVIIIAVATISAFLFFFGILSGKGVKEMFITVTALSVSMIPEGLPIVLTLVLVTGVWRMAKHNALVKKLQAVEALGQATIIALDKTGTITKNEMVVQRVFIGGNFFEVGGTGYEPSGDFFIINEGGDKKIISPPEFAGLLKAGKIAALSTNTRAAFSEEAQKWQISGDPTEAALSIFGQKLGFKKDELEGAYSFLKETPFDYKRKYRASLYENAELGFLAVAGAPEKVVKLCSKILMDGEEKILSAEAAEELKMIFHKMLSDGLRVLAVAMKSSLKLKNKKPDSVLDAPERLTFVGFCGIKDDIRPQVRESVERLKNAGIKTVMITGDHRLTAHAIAREVGIWNEGDEILNGDEIEEMSEKGLVLRLAPGRVSVFARVTPENKLKIIKAYKESGEIVAMTGDGVNDAPPLVAADLGVAMGKIGTEVAKEASDIVLLDDNLGSIVSAVEEGRSIYKTIKKVILYLFSTSVGEAFTISVAIFFGWPLPILAGQIIWLNLITDGFLDMALAMEPKEDGLLSGNFKRSKKYLVDSLMLWRIAVMAVPMMIGTLFLFNKYARGVDANMVKAWTISLTTLAAFQWFNAWNCRSEEKSIFHLSPYSNKFLVGATLTVVFLQMFALNNPFMQKVLRVVPLSVSEWAMILSVAFSIVIIEEARKFIYRRRKFLV